MEELMTQKFPYSSYDVVVVKKEDILKTISDNITDTEVALELISHLEAFVQTTLQAGGWAGVPYFGNMRVKLGYRTTQSQEIQDAKEWAFRNMRKDEYVMFCKQCNQAEYYYRKYQQYFITRFNNAVRGWKVKYAQLCAERGHSYAVCKIIFLNSFKPMKEEFEYDFDDEEEIVNDVEEDYDTDEADY